MPTKQDFDRGFLHVTTALRLVREMKGNKPAGEGRIALYMAETDASVAQLELELSEAVIDLHPFDPANEEAAPVPPVRPKARRGKKYPPLNTEEAE